MATKKSLSIFWGFIFPTFVLASVGCSSSETTAPEAVTATESAAAQDAQSQKTQAATRSQSRGQTNVSAEKSVEDPLHPIAVIKTSLGDITVKLDMQRTPTTVDSFLKCASSGAYDQTIFHEVQKGEIVLGGGYTAELIEKNPDLPFIHNEARDAMKNRRATIAMARAQSNDSARSQFFFNLEDHPNLDCGGKNPDQFGYCVFGEVIKGFDVVEKISNLPVQTRTKDGQTFQNVPVKTVLIESVTLLR